MTASYSEDLVRAPSSLLRVLEARAVYEAGSLIAASPFLQLVKRGDAHPVFVMPGFGASDRSTMPLRWQIKQWGYDAYGWELGTNMGPTPEIVASLQERLSVIHEKHGQKVSLVGWSLGGIYARFLARNMPEMVRQVVTLGSPFRMTHGDRSTVSALADVLEHTWDQGITVHRLPEHQKSDLLVPSTAVYTKTDGVVRWHTCIDAGGSRRENVEVRGSHSGLGFNASVLYIVGNRLAQAPEDWMPFKPPMMLALAYPKPEIWSGDS